MSKMSLGRPFPTLRRTQILILSTAIAALSEVPAQAFLLPEHRRIVDQAVSEYNACHWHAFSDWARLVIWTSDAEEDLNLVRKDLTYSHFYHPLKNLQMYRFDSSARIRNLEGEIHSPKRPDFFASGMLGFLPLAAIGHAVHHLQDMAVPAHVVPVMHGPTDGFEMYSFSGPIDSGLNCGAIDNLIVPEAGQDLTTVLRETALQTLAGIADLDVMAVPVVGAPLHLRGVGFWVEAFGPKFGTYGQLGNSFGQADLRFANDDYRVARAFYDRFKQAQLRLAVRATLSAFVWYLQPRAGSPRLPPTRFPNEAPLKIPAN